MLKRRRPFLTAKRLLTNQTFRDLYRTDTLDIDQRLLPGQHLLQAPPHRRLVDRLDDVVIGHVLRGVGIRRHAEPGHRDETHRFRAAGNDDVRAAGDDPLGSRGDGLQAAGAETVDGLGRNIHR